MLLRHGGPFSAAPLPVCGQLAAECLSIPIYPELTREQQDSVIAAIGDFLNQD
jgi:dTDP-4-amino-4,6-dideoxygalactose transaminase